ncbi:hypothetical protein GE061_012766 [Apolygus lucorum]|uniref:Peptidase S1 domain-containing protein n=1 Tax=Apolygus lucorum TaxID=248454 RepID=A0A8S9XXA2_APOLU|nr:hypothetical protein GE061_012766 [Apolygus lucorum]
MFYGVLCLVVLWISPLVYSVIKPVYEDDSELYVEWKKPKPDEYDKLLKTDGAKYVGNLFAGRAEFPFLVDVRSENSDPEENWAVGNLITAWHVITSCRALKEYVGEKSYYPNGTEYTIVTSRSRSNVRVNFAPTYLWENHPRNIQKKLNPVFNDTETYYLESGTRLAQEVHFHQECGKALSYDLGLIHLLNSIDPLLPVIQYMKLFWRKVEVGNQMVVQDFNMTEQEDEKRVCYIASYGRGWLNWKTNQENIVTDYKVRYRAYFEKIETCFEAAFFFQLEAEQTIGKNLPKYPLDYYNPSAPVNKEVDERNTYCMITRAKVGNVCDHDRGAPLVCDGLVNGFVVRGTQLQYCSNLLPMPFLVVRATVMHAYYSHAVAGLIVRYDPGYAHFINVNRSPAQFHRYFHLHAILFALLMNHLLVFH